MSIEQQDDAVHALTEEVARLRRMLDEVDRQVGAALDRTQPIYRLGRSVTATVDDLRRTLSRVREAVDGPR